MFIAGDAQAASGAIAKLVDDLALPRWCWERSPKAARCSAWAAR
ncbi:hypothetical protein [Variovorax sp. E3]|nr:hypothetical protein [Variovorax sp. E3]